MSTPRIGSGRGLTAPRGGLYGPGRPRKEPKPGHNTGIDEANVGVNAATERGAPVSQAIAPVPPRLLDLEAAAAYLGVSPWTVRDLEAIGTLRRVSIPVGNKDLRKLLFDRVDLDELIEHWKTS